MAHHSPPTEGPLPTEAHLSAEENPVAGHLLTEEDSLAAAFANLPMPEQPAPAKALSAQPPPAEPGLVRASPCQVPEDDIIFFKKLKEATRLAQSVNGYYACDSCFNVHPITPGYGADPASTASPGDKHRASTLLRYLEAVVSNSSYQRLMFSEEEMDDLEQTHVASVNTSFMSVVKGEGKGEIPEETRRERISGARPPCMQRHPLLQLPRCIPVEPKVFGYFHMFIDPARDGRRTPLAGLMHHHVQMALKRFRLKTENPVSRWFSCKPSRILGSYRGFSEDIGDFASNFVGSPVDDSKKKEPLLYKFEPRIVEYRGENMYAMKTTVTTGLTTPISLCPHQALTQIPRRGSDCPWNKPYQNRRNAEAGWSALFDCSRCVPDGERKTSTESRSLFTYELKGSRPGSAAARMPAAVEGLRDKAMHFYLNKEAYQARYSSWKPEIHASCRHCPTDFEIVQVGSSKMQYTVWQNFGVEGSALDPVWQSHIQGPFLQDTFKFTDKETLAHMTPEEQSMPWEENSYNAGPSVYAEHGAIRRLYESHDVDAAEGGTGNTPRL